MKIAYITADFGIPVHGNKGASIHVREMSSALTDLGHHVEIITCRMGGDAPAAFDVPVHEFPLSKPERLTVGSLQDDPHATEPMAKEVRSMLYNATLLYRVMPLLQEMQPDAIYERYSLLGTAGMEIARDLGIPHILEVNAPLSEEHAQHRGSAFAQTIRATEQRILGAADHIISVSEPLKQWIVETGVAPERVTVLPNGVNIKRFATQGEDIRAKLGLTDRPVVGFVGTLKAWHGTATLIRAVGALVRERDTENAPHLLIVGDGPQRETLESIAAEEGIAPLTTFTGMITHDEMPAHIAAMDIAVAPYDATPDFYFSPLKLFEYMAAGRPVIAAAIGQIETCVRDGETGLLYEPGNVGALSSRIAELLDDPERASEIGQAAQQEARSHWSWERNAQVVTGLVADEYRRRAAPVLTSATATGGADHADS